MYNLKYGSNEPIYETKNRLMDIENRFLAKWERRGWGIDWDFGVSRCKHLHLEWIHNKVLLYSTGNYIKSPGINHNGKEYKKECMYKCINHFSVEQKLINTVNQLS